ncbi:ribonuclease P subunit p25 [Pelobates cultripes]|uniref:Ribonuclease P subunit p25 n=1 Tax=Pelobates cultripes TaxID=61616 RepID=A0AAD1RKP9_PELCU|nr:ribonuclease P subunit p25 [Pelobates cultripes]
MENFRRIQTTDEEDGTCLPFKDLSPDVVQMKVKEGSKIRNLIGYAVAHMGCKGGGQIIFSAHGRAVTKAVTCVEILKRQIGGLHQITKLQYKTLQEVWEQKGPGVQNPAPCLTVQKNLPSICILLSKLPLDPQEDGYQPPQSIAHAEVGKREFVDHENHFISKKSKPQDSTEVNG